MRVAEPATATASLGQRKKELKPLIEPMVTRGIQLGLTDEQILAVTKSVLKERRS
jgi:DNA-binding transcriptional regulator YhcF (GntR family)